MTRNQQVKQQHIYKAETWSIKIGMFNFNIPLIFRKINMEFVVIYSTTQQFLYLTCSTCIKLSTHISFSSSNTVHQMESV